ncbi:uncharacterized protein LOC132243447 [Alligator mississippiensis]|uniref:uncharacterized protein LOC132243447 n=1 Tax=Alligator mississippiensis TaxID=8496 RepID=UPI002877E214|nr:uncharacterized protein LOC132243447 [Alligator mississippiensis]
MHIAIHTRAHAGRHTPRCTLICAHTHANAGIHIYPHIHAVIIALRTDAPIHIYTHMQIYMHAYAEIPTDVCTHRPIDCKAGRDLGRSSTPAPLHHVHRYTTIYACIPARTYTHIYARKCVFKAKSKGNTRDPSLQPRGEAGGEEGGGGRGRSTPPPPPASSSWGVISCSPLDTRLGERGARSLRCSGGHMSLVSDGQGEAAAAGRGQAPRPTPAELGQPGLHRAEWKLSTAGGSGGGRGAPRLAPAEAKRRLVETAPSRIVNGGTRPGAPCPSPASHRFPSSPAACRQGELARHHSPGSAARRGMICILFVRSFPPLHHQ